VITYNSPNRYLDVPRLIDWLSARQYAPEGGFAGRTNKLVDGCYSHWIGACWPLIEACLDGNPSREKILENDSLYSREGLIRYILCCGQDTSARGGLRDKPSTYVLPNPSKFFRAICANRRLGILMHITHVMSQQDSVLRNTSGNLMRRPEIFRNRTDGRQCRITARLPMNNQSKSSMRLTESKRCILSSWSPRAWRTG
jgi:hypothetical protein